MSFFPQCYFLYQPTYMSLSIHIYLPHRQSLTHTTVQNHSQTHHSSIYICSPDSPSPLHHHLASVGLNSVHSPPGISPVRARIRHPRCLARGSPLCASFHRGLPVRIRRSERFQHRTNLGARGDQKCVPEMGGRDRGPDYHGAAARAGSRGCGGCSRSVMERQNGEGVSNEGKKRRRDDRKTTFDERHDKRYACLRELAWCRSAQERSTGVVICGKAGRGHGEGSIKEEGEGWVTRDEVPGRRVKRVTSRQVKQSGLNELKESCNCPSSE